MKRIILLVIILLPLFVFSQNKEVDKRNGFKEIKLGEPIESFGNLKVLPQSDDTKIVGIWNTSENNLNFIFSYKIDFFELTFDKESRKLIMLDANIIIKKPYIDKSVTNIWKSINDKLIVSLGSPSKVRNNPVFSLEWYGKSTIITTRLIPDEMKLDDNANTIGLTRIIFTVLNPEAIQEKLKQGF